MPEAENLSQGELREWLRERVAFYLDRPAEKIDTSAELSRYGMDSVYAISVIRDIEDRFHLEVDMNQAQQRTTIDALADYLLKAVAALSSMRRVGAGPRW